MVIGEVSDFCLDLIAETKERSVFFMYNNYYSGYDNNNANYDDNSNNNSTVPTYQPPKPTKANIETYIANTLGVEREALRFEQIIERPHVWKHSCLSVGVGVLPEKRLNFFNVVMIYYSVCDKCCEVIYYVEE